MFIKATPVSPSPISLCFLWILAERKFAGKTFGFCPPDPETGANVIKLFISSPSLTIHQNKLRPVQ
jgi:hypothetical protein